MITASLTSFLTANFVVFGIIILSFVIVTTISDVFWIFLERRRGDDRD